GEAAAGAAGRNLLATGQPVADARGRSRNRGYEHQYEGGHRAQGFPRGPLLPPERILSIDSAVVRAARGDSAACLLLHAQSCEEVRTQPASSVESTAGCVLALLVAGQSARDGEHRQSLLHPG